MTYAVVKSENGFKGQIEHDLHKRPERKGHKLTTYSNKEYKTFQGAINWLNKQIAIQTKI